MTDPSLMCSIGTKILITPEIFRALRSGESDSLLQRGAVLLPKCSSGNRAHRGVRFTRLMRRGHARMIIDLSSVDSEVLNFVKCVSFVSAEAASLRERHERREMKCGWCFAKYSFGVWAAVWSH